jgi:site-specific recombinase XerD
VAEVIPISESVPLPPEQPRLLDRVRTAIRTRHYSLRTEEAYVGWIKRFIFFHNKRHPAEMGEPEINRFLSHLAVKDRVSASTQNQALSALLFLYRRVLEKPFPTLENIVRAKKPKRLPTVMTQAEVKAVLRHLDGVPKIIAMLLYGSGLRLLEGLRLRVKDIEFGMNRITVRDAKGQKDRYVPLPVVVRPALVSWLAQVKKLHEEDVARGNGASFCRTPWSASIRAHNSGGAGSGSSRPKICRPIRVPTSFVAITCTSESFKGPWRRPRAPLE